MQMHGQERLGWFDVAALEISARARADNRRAVEPALLECDGLMNVFVIKWGYWRCAAYIHSLEACYRRVA